MNNNKQFVFFDIETTGNGPLFGRIVELGAVYFDLEGNIINKFQSLVNPQCQIDSQSYSVHKISNEMVLDSPTIDEILPKFINFIEDYPLMAHYAHFDTSHIGTLMSKYGITAPSNKIYDSIDVIRTLLPELPEHGLDFLRKEFNLNVGVTHRAIDDCIDAINAVTYSIRNTKLSSLEIENAFDSYKVYHFHNYKIIPSKLDDKHKQIEQAVKLKTKIKISYKTQLGKSFNNEIYPIAIFKHKGLNYIDCLLGGLNEVRYLILDNITII